MDSIAIDGNDMELGETFDFGLGNLVEFGDDEQLVTSSFKGAESQNDDQSQVILNLPEKLRVVNENHSMETETIAICETMDEEFATAIDTVVQEMPIIQVHKEKFVTPTEVIS